MARDHAAQAAAGHSRTHQMTCYDRKALKTAKRKATSIALATNSTDSRDRPERQADVVGEKVARGRVSLLFHSADRACTRIDEWCAHHWWGASRSVHWVHGRTCSDAHERGLVPVGSRAWAARKRGDVRCGNEYIPHRMVGGSAAGMGDARCTGSEKGRSRAR